MPAVEEESANSGRTLLLACCDTGEVDEKLKLLKSTVGRQAKGTIKYMDQNKIFMGHLSLALSTATLVVMFGLPLFSSHLRTIVFGDHRCDPAAHGLYLLKEEDGTEPTLTKVKDLSSLEVSDYMNIVDCGFIPSSYKGYWPNVVQFCFFSILTNTGTTVQLTLQGFFGTFLATLNVWVLYQIFPLGSQMECPGGAETCDPIEMVYKDPNYIPAVVWAEAILFALFWLVSKAPKNMVMFLASYHVYFISKFLNPAVSGLTGSLPMGFLGLYWDSEPTIINMTSLLGGVLAIVGTLIPKPLLNTKALQENALTAVEGMTDAWEKAIDYFIGDTQQAVRFSVASKMDAVKGSFDRTEDSINGAWFEHFDIGHFGVARELFRLFVEAGHGMNKLLAIAKTALVREKFDGNHKEFCSGVGKDMKELNEATTDLFMLCCRCCVDGHLSREEKEELNEKLSVVKGKEKDLARSYRETMKNQPYVSEDLSNENCFVYGFAAYVRTVVELANDLPDLAAKKETSKCKNFWGGICGMIADMFSCDLLLQADNLKFSIVNFLPILVTFLIAYFADADNENHIFVSHAPLMPGTLALIITASYGSTFKGNIDRLVGLVLGNVIPLLVLAVVFSFSCESWMRTAAQMILVFLYFLTFSYVYYSSKTWGFVGCALCGFGAYPLMVSCEAGEGAAGSFNYHMRSNYKVIAQTTVAVLIRMFIETALLDKAPRDLAVDQLKDLLESVEDAYEEFFEGDFEGMKEKYDQVQKMLASCETYYADTSPQLEFAPGPRLPFKHKFFGDVQAQLKVAISELGVLAIGAGDWTKAQVGEEKSSMRQAQEQEEAKHRHPGHVPKSAIPPPHGIMSRQSNFSLMQKDILQTTKLVFDTVLALLKQEKEEGLAELKDSFKKLSGMSGMLDLEDAPGFYTQVNHHMSGQLESLKPGDSLVDDMQARLTVVVGALKSTTAALGEIGVLCLKENIY